MNTPRFGAFLSVLLILTAVLLPSTSATAATKSSARVAGLNNYSCKPSAGHTRPVVIVPGGTGTVRDWAPTITDLTKSGYCVYGKDYGGVFTTLGLINGVAPISDSAAGLAAFIDDVRRRTGAAKVDLLGHSEGGLLTLYYAKILTGGANVDKIIAMAPPTNGTDFNGLLKKTQGRKIALALLNGVGTLLCPACLDMTPTSKLIKQLTSGTITVPGVEYTIVATRYDEIVTPVVGQFIAEPGVRNVYVQSICPDDHVGHGRLPVDPVVRAFIKNTLNPQKAEKISCTG